jgi:hypothetical protein
MEHSVDDPNTLSAIARSCSASLTGRRCIAACFHITGRSSHPPPYHPTSSSRICCHLGRRHLGAAAVEGGCISELLLEDLSKLLLSGEDASRSCFWRTSRSCCRRRPRPDTMPVPEGRSSSSEDGMGRLLDWDVVGWMPVSL